MPGAADAVGGAANALPAFHDKTRSALGTEALLCAHALGTVLPPLAAAQTVQLEAVFALSALGWIDALDAVPGARLILANRE